MHPGNNASDNAAAAPSNGNVQPVIREQDRFMPIANVIRIMRRVLPAHAKISDDAKETIQECVSEYISFITSEANDRCQQEQRKTVTAEDVIWAMSKLGFDNYVDPLTHFLHGYRETEGANRGSMRGGQLPLRRMRSGTSPLQLQPATLQMDPRMFVATQPQPPLHVNTMGGVNAVPQQQQGADGGAMAGYYGLGAYGDFDSYAEYNRAS